PSAVKQEPRSVSTCVTWKGKAWTASVRKATALRSVWSSLTARWTKREARSMATYRVALAALAILGAQLGQVLDVHVHEAEVIRLEAAVRSAGAACGRQAAQALGFQDAVDRVTVEMRQKVADHKGE